MSRIAPFAETTRTRLRLIRLALCRALADLPVEMMLDQLQREPGYSGPDRLLDELSRP